MVRTEFEYEIWDQLDLDAGEVKTIIRRNNIPLSIEEWQDVWNSVEDRLA